MLHRTLPYLHRHAVIIWTSVDRQLAVNRTGDPTGASFENPFRYKYSLGKNKIQAEPSPWSHCSVLDPLSGLWGCWGNVLRAHRCVNPTDAPTLGAEGYGQLLGLISSHACACLVVPLRFHSTTATMRAVYQLGVCSWCSNPAGPNGMEGTRPAHGSVGMCLWVCRRGSGRMLFCWGTPSSPSCQHAATRIRSEERR